LNEREKYQKLNMDDHGASEEFNKIEMYMNNEYPDRQSKAEKIFTKLDKIIRQLAFDERK